MKMDLVLIVKVQQFEDKRIAAKADWNIKTLKGKLCEIYPTSSEEQKLIYSGKLLNDTVVLKDVLREYEGQEAHTVHLVFTPKNTPGKSHSKFEKQNTRQSSPVEISQSTSASANMSSNELRQRNIPSGSSATPTNPQPQPQPQPQPYQTNMDIPSYLNAFYASSGASGGDANSILSHQYAMHSWMQQAYTQYMNQYMSLLSSPEAFYQLSQQQQSQSPQNFAFVQPQMPLGSPPPSDSSILNNASQLRNNNLEAQPAQGVQPAAAAAAEPAQRRFPNIIQDEQENRDWLDIMYSVSRLMILLCLIYFYSSPVRCLVVILIGIMIYLYHIYKQNQNRMNNNNVQRVNLNNVNRPEPVAPPQPAGEDVPDNSERAERNVGDVPSEDETLAASTLPDEPQVPLLTIVRTFVLSFFSSIIPEAPAL